MNSAGQLDRSSPGARLRGREERCSVVLASHQLSGALVDSVASALEALAPLSPRGECLVILDGLGPAAGDQLRQELQEFTDLLRIHCVAKGGLTHALIQGCALASGTLIARLDVGDAMDPERLTHQMQGMARHPECVLVTSDVQVCGPRWEPLWIAQGNAPRRGQPVRVDTIPAREGLAMDIPHHSSVLFRRSAYEAVGGYRAAFYFGQDWDLWYRLSGCGSFLHLPEVLTRVRLFADGLSSRHWREQREIARLSLACHRARSEGRPEAPLLEQAAGIRPRSEARSGLKQRKPLLDGRYAEGAYFIAEALRRNRDPRSRHYFLQALRHGFWKPRIWVRALQSLVILQAVPTTPRP